MIPPRINNIAHALLLSRFSSFVAGVAGPGFRRTWYGDRICDAIDLAALTALGLPGGVDVIVVNMPPRHGKTFLAGEWLPPYLWALFPGLEVIGWTYSAENARKTTRKIRGIMGLPAYLEASRARIGWTRDSRGVRVEGEATANSLDVLWEGAAPGTKIGRYLGTSPGALATGHGAHAAVYDDLIPNLAAAQSPSKRHAIEDALEGVAETRLYPANVQIAIATRWDVLDPVGFLERRWIEQGKRMIRLRLRAIRRDDGPEVDAYDPRAVGEPLDPKSAHLYAAAAKGSAWEPLWQQNPVTATGHLFPRGRWGVYAPEWLESSHAHTGGIVRGLVISVDPNFVGGGSSFAAIVVTAHVVIPGAQPWEPSRAEAWILEVRREKWEWTHFRANFFQIWEKWGRAVTDIVVEASANGYALVSEIHAALRAPQRWMGAVEVHQIPPRGGTKVERAQLAKPAFDAGLWKIPSGASRPVPPLGLPMISTEWVGAFLAELDKFGREADNDDQADAFVLAARLLSDRGVRPSESVIDVPVDVPDP